MSTPGLAPSDESSTDGTLRFREFTQHATARSATRAKVLSNWGRGSSPIKPILIPEVDFSRVARALGAESAVIRSLSDPSALQGWIDTGAHGTFVVDCRITSSVRAPWLTERMNATRAAKAAVAG